MSDKKNESKNNDISEASNDDKPEEILYLFSNTYPTYIPDALDLLALPSGMSYRFRYDVNHLPENLFKGSEKKELIDLKDKSTLLIHIQTKLKGEYTEPKPPIIEAIPLRRSKILTAKLMGDFVWIHFKLGNWIKYTSKKSNSALNPYHTTIVANLPSDANGLYKYTAFLGAELNLEEIISTSEDTEEVLSNWTNLVSYVSAMKEHENSIFLKFLSIKTINEDIIFKPEKLDGEIFGFKLNSNGTYMIQILQRAFNENKNMPFILKFDTNSNDVINIKATDKIQGKYDVLRFTFTTDQLLKPRHSFLNITPPDLLSEKLLISKPFYHLKIASNKIRIGVTVLLMISGIALTASGDIVETINETAAGVVPVIGGVLSALGAFWLPKK